jgi:hypothetical protein
VQSYAECFNICCFAEYRYAGFLNFCCFAEYRYAGFLNFCCFAEHSYADCLNFCCFAEYRCAGCSYAEFSISVVLLSSIMTCVVILKVIVSLKYLL